MDRRRTVGLVLGAGMLLCPTIAWASIETPEEAQARAGVNPPGAAAAGQPDRVSLIVYMEPGADFGPVRAFAAQQGGFVKYEYKVVLPEAINLRNVPVSAIAALEKIPGVARIEQDQYHERVIQLDEATPLIRALQSQVTGAGFSADGTGVRVCICDTGIDSDHLMYADRIDTAAGRDFYNDDNNPEDDHGHGSHVSGIAVGGTGLSVDFGCEGPEPFQGIAPEATLIGAKILNQFGGGFDSDIIAGIDYCADQSPSGGRADVINLSIGTGQFSGPCTHSWAVAANNAVDNGVVVVAASGNENFSNALSSPACGVNVIAVGATYKDSYPNCENGTSNFNWGNCIDSSPSVDDIVCFSNESDFLDVAAPGSVIWSASNSPGGSSIVGQSGTSMASPMVAGLAALILDADGSLTPAEVRQIIRDGAIDMGTAGFDRAYGYGRIDILNSLALVGPACTVPADCDDGLWCNGAEDCIGGSCQAGTDPCPGQGCDEVNDVCVPLVCDNDGTCESGEDCNNCSNDCISGTTSGAVCGNSLCEAGNGEDCVSCPADCNGKQTGAPSGRYCCGDGDGVNPLPCSNPTCSTGGWSCTDTPSGGGTTYCCGDGTCEGAEDFSNCYDCPAPFCGDLNCDPGEDQCDCPGDCGAPPSTETNCTDGVDNDCDGQTDGNDPDCACGAKGTSCSVDADCCSNKCRGGACR